jgi:hypothetical protein
MLLLILVVWVGLCLLFAAGSLFLQSYLNESPPSLQDISWRAPTAGTLVAALIGLWCFLATGNPDQWTSLTEFSPRQEQMFDKLKVVTGKETREFVKRKNEQGRTIYRDRQTNAPMPAQPDKVIVVEDGEEAVFNPDRDAKGKLKIEPGAPLCYRDDRGRVMEDGFLGQVSTVRGGWMFMYILLNLLHLGVWFAALWPVMRFSLGQAILISIIAWLTTTLVVLPPLLTQARRVHDNRSRAAHEVSGSLCAGIENGREDLAILSPVWRVRQSSPHELGCRPGQSGIHFPAGHFEATVEGNSILTFTSWPAVTLTRSSRTSPLNSAFTV